MSDQLPSTRRERRIGFHSEAPFAKHEYRFRNRLDIRLAGKIWEEGPRERQIRLARERNKRRGKQDSAWIPAPTSNKPDEDYSTVEYITHIPGLAD
jgi:hypothetical protein